jgi:copper chaperone CopZ
VEKAKIDVPGLDNPSSQVNLESLLSNINGVDSVEADPFEHTVVVEYDPDVVREDNLVNEIAKLKLSTPNL